MVSQRKVYHATSITSVTIRLSPSDNDQDKPNEHYRRAVINPFGLVDHKARSGPTHKAQALAHPEQPHRQSDDADKRQSCFHAFTGAELDWSRRSQ